MSIKGVSSKDIDTTIIEGIKNFKSLAQIGREIGLSRQAVSKRVEKLRENGFVQKIGQSSYKLLGDELVNVGGITPSTIRSKKKASILKGSCRPHAFSFTLDIPDRFKEKFKNNREAFLVKRKVKTYPLGNKYWKGWGFTFKGQIIHLNNYSITCMWRKDDFINTDSAYEGKRFALFRLYDLLEALEIWFGFSLKDKGEWLLRTDAQHFAQLESEMAYDYVKKGKKFQVRNKVTGKVWGIVDISIKGKPELEFIDKGDSDFHHDAWEDNINDWKDSGCKTTSERIDEAKLEVLNFMKEALGQSVPKKPDPSIKRLSDYGGDMFG